MTKTEYAQYLAGPQWKAFRDSHLEVISYCERCKMPRWLASIAYDQDLNLHHKTYINRGKEIREDMEVLCKRCHEIETFKRSELRAPKESTCVSCHCVHWNYRSDYCPTCEAIWSYGHLGKMASFDESGDEEISVNLALSLCCTDKSDHFIEKVLRLISGLSKRIATHHAWMAKRRA